MKKQIMSIVLAVSMLASLFTAFMLPAVAADPILRDVLVTDKAIKVDGKLEDEYLSSSVIKSIHKIKDTANSKLGFEGYALATSEGFYFWLEIVGDTTYVNSGDTNLHDYGNNNRDYLQVYYNMSAEGKTDYIGYIMHDYRNSVYFRNPKGTVDANGAKAENYTYSAPAGFQSTAVKTETGWISEMFIPWVAGTPAADGMSASNLSTNFRIGFQYNDDYDGNNDYNCAVYDDKTTSYWSDYNLMPKVTFVRNFGRLSKTNVFLDGDITLDYNVNAGGAYDSTQMYVRYTVTGKDGTTSYTVPGKLVDPALDTIRFSLSLAPYRMNDTIKVELIHKGKVVHEQPAYTVRQFCLDSLNLAQEDTDLTYNQFAVMQRLSVELLNFGAMAQKYSNYDVDNLVNAGYERDFEDVEIEYSDIVVSDKAAGYDNVDFVAYNMYFDGESRFAFKVKVDASEAANVKVSVYEGAGKPAEYISLTEENYDATEGVYTVYSSPIDPSDYDHIYTVRLEYIDDLGTDWERYNIVQSVKCSVNTYLGQIVATSTNADMVALAKAAYLIGCSANHMANA